MYFLFKFIVVLGVRGELRGGVLEIVVYSYFRFVFLNFVGFLFSKLREMLGFNL